MRGSLCRPVLPNSEADSEESNLNSSERDSSSWISRFCNLRGNEFFCKVNEEYIQEKFCPCVLMSCKVPYCYYALDLILHGGSSHGKKFTEVQHELVESAAEVLYGLIHIKYILTSEGMSAMSEKYKNGDFGRCPKVNCCGQPCLPIGLTDIPGFSTVKIYCPKCEDINYPRSKSQNNIDGAYFGTTFPYLCLQSIGCLGGTQINSLEAAGSQLKILISSLQNPLATMNKTVKRYKVCEATDEEQGKQRRLKAILNKLTFNNLDNLLERVKAVKVDKARTLRGFVAQIFEKAITEPTFCEVYANFCHYLYGDMPDLIEDDTKITFKRLLLDKCQKEFERGEREQEEANEGVEAGKMSHTVEEREDNRVNSRRRTSGNIRFIGELFKKKMLTERIMHECIKKLLRRHQTPNEDDIETLCILMSSIGHSIDHSIAKKHIDAYFEEMINLSNNMELSLRVRFMLKDSIELRRNNWRRREGPKKTEEMLLDRHRRIQVARASVFELKQMRFKAILNKLTPQYNERLHMKVKSVYIDDAHTLSGVVAQIHEKASMEPTFCEMYANFCYHLSEDMPVFIEDCQTITFKRLLINKCQEACERGEREREEANEGGEASVEEREENRLNSRWRALGNIRFIGELFKKKMLTERIVHECIKKLLGQHQTPEEDDIEALCMLMSTIGHSIDHSKAKDHMDAYFEAMMNLSNNLELSLRVRFMLKDLIHLRNDGWALARATSKSPNSLPKTSPRLKAGLNSYNHRDVSKPIFSPGRSQAVCDPLSLLKWIDNDHDGKDTRDLDNFFNGLLMSSTNPRDEESVFFWNAMIGECYRSFLPPPSRTEALASAWNAAIKEYHRIMGRVKIDLYHKGLNWATICPIMVSVLCICIFYFYFFTSTNYFMMLSLLLYISCMLCANL